MGSKKTQGLISQKARLTGGKLYGVYVTGMNIESNINLASNTVFTLADLGTLESMSGAALNTLSDSKSVTKFLRPEDRAWDPIYPENYYFVTSNSFNNPGRLWRLTFADINNPVAGVTITAVLKGTEGQQMLYNSYGFVLMQEDMESNSHPGKIWQNNIKKDDIT